MACEYICDGCGVRKPALRGANGWIQPHNWYSRRDQDGEQNACSRECIDRVAMMSGKTDLILPI